MCKVLCTVRTLRCPAEPQLIYLLMYMVVAASGFCRGQTTRKSPFFTEYGPTNGIPVRGRWRLVLGRSGALTTSKRQTSLATHSLEFIRLPSCLPCQQLTRLGETPIYPPALGIGTQKHPGLSVDSVRGNKAVSPRNKGEVLYLLLKSRRTALAAKYRQFRKLVCQLTPVVVCRMG